MGLYFVSIIVDLYEIDYITKGSIALKSDYVNILDDINEVRVYETPMRYSAL